MDIAEISKFLSYVLRHKPEAIGLTLDSEGWTLIEQLLACAARNGKHFGRADLEIVVATNDKKRFTLSEDGLRIRAAQGHSTAAVTITHVEKTPPEILYHGTAERFLESILRQGLIPGVRHHVHLSDNPDIARNVGRRYGKPVVLKIAALQMKQAGFTFFQADNDVWLIANVPPKFLSEHR